MVSVGLALVLALSVSAQRIDGQWGGVLEVMGQKLRLVFHFETTASGLSATMDSPDQGAKGIRASAVSFQDSLLKVEVGAAGIRYQGLLAPDGKILGEFRQAGIALPLTLSRQEAPIAVVEPVRPQTPKPPYPYTSEAVRVKNTVGGVELAGTLTLPAGKGPFPAVVLISGSGPQDRDEALMGHRPFLVLSDALTRKGLAVLRCDDRGVGESTGDFSKATSEDFVTDVEAMVAYLSGRPEILPKQISLVGHSEGGMIAPMVAARNKRIRSIVLMAGPGIPSDSLLMLQTALISRAQGVPEAQVQRALSVNRTVYQWLKSAAPSQELRPRIARLFTEAMSDTVAGQTEAVRAALVEAQVQQLELPWFRYFIRYDPGPVLQRVTCPVLALNGSKDLQVPARENLSGIKKNLDAGGNHHLTIREYPGLNHLFQPCTTGSPKEYPQIETTISERVLPEMADWIWSWDR
jgi:pimeloyl-ACP methyl ester carboxylesterase